MGFTAGFTSGVTLTLGIAYLTVLSHERNRQAQGANLRTQASLLDTLLGSDPTLANPDPEVGRTSRATLVETAKDRWNDELQNAVRWVQGAEWGDMKEGVEGAAAKVWGTGLARSREEIQAAEENAGPIAREAIARAREGATMGFDGTRAAAERSAARVLGAGNEREERFEGKTEHGFENSSAVAKAAWKKGKEKSHEIADGLKLTEAAAANAVKETWQKGKDATHAVDQRELRFEGKTEHGFENSSAVAKEAWRKSVEKGREIEEGLELTEKSVAEAVRHTLHKDSAKGAEVAEGLKHTEEGVVGAVKKSVEHGKERMERVKSYVTEGMERAKHRDEAIYAHTNQAQTGELTDVQRALRQRYTPSDAFSKTAKEALADRYKPIDQRSNTSLRGL